MKKIFLVTLMVVSMAMIFGFAQISFAQTNTGGGGSGTGGVKGGLNDLKSKTGDSYPTNVVADDATLTDVFAKILNWALGIGFAIAVIFVIYGGYQYMTAAGNEQQATEARRTITYAAIGIVVVVLSFALVRTIVNFASDNNSGGGSSNNPTNNPANNNGP